MAITNFIPKVWSAQILVALRKYLVFGQPGTINRDYEGEIAEAGDTVHITSWSDPTVRNYVRNTDITWELLTDADRQLVIDQQKYFAFTVDDVDKRQALPGFIPVVANNAAYKLAEQVDSFLSAKMVAEAGVNLGAVTVNSADTAYSLLLSLRQGLVTGAVPEAGRWVAIPTSIYNYLLRDDRFVRSDAAPGQTVQTGQVGRALGFTVLESQTLPAGEVLAGSPIAVTYAEQIAKTEAVRLQNQFGDGIRGLHVYGAKTIRPEALVKAQVTVT